MNFRKLVSVTMVGIDIQREAARLVQITRQRQKIHIDRLASISMQSNVFNRDIIEDWQQLREVVSELVITAEVRKAPATICVPAGLVESGNIILSSWLSSSAIKSAIATQIGGYEAWQIDYMRQPGDTKNESIISYVATHQHYLNQYVRCMESCGLKVRHVDVDIYALKRAAEHQLLDKMAASSVYMQHAAGSEQNYYIAAGLALYGI